MPEADQTTPAGPARHKRLRNKHGPIGGDHSHVGWFEAHAPQRRFTVKRKKSRGSISVLAVLVVTSVAGALFGISAANAKAKPSWADLNLFGLVSEQQQVVLRLEEQVTDLRTETEALVTKTLADTTVPSETVTPRGDLEGPGITVSLDDSPPDFQLDDSTNVNVAVVHQQDVDAVMNALRRGGAEAMSVQGVRVTSTTPVRCIGNVILVGSKSFAPPYKIAAIGDVDAMLASLDEDDSVRNYRQDVARYNLGWDVQVSDSMTVPAATQTSPVRFATVLGRK